MQDKINDDLKQAMLDGDSLKTGVLRSLKTAIKNAEVENKGQLDDDGLVKALRRQAKQRQEAADAYTQAGDSDSADKEQAEKDIIDAYLPAQMSEADINKVIDDVVAAAGDSANQGQIMGQVMGRLKDQADGSLVSRLVQSRLG